MPLFLPFRPKERMTLVTTGYVVGSFLSIAAAWATVAPGNASTWILGSLICGSHFRFESPMIMTGCVGLMVQELLSLLWWWTVCWAQEWSTFLLAAILPVGGASARVSRGLEVGALVGVDVLMLPIGFEGAKRGLSMSSLREDGSGRPCAAGRCCEESGVLSLMLFHSRFSCELSIHSKSSWRGAWLVVTSAGVTKGWEKSSMEKGAGGSSDMGESGIVTKAATEKGCGTVRVVVVVVVGIVGAVVMFGWETGGSHASVVVVSVRFFGRMAMTRSIVPVLRPALSPALAIGIAANQACSTLGSDIEARVVQQWSIAAV